MFLCWGNFAVTLSDKWVVKNKVSLLHYSYWRDGQRRFFIILNFESFFSKSPHCLCLKINFKLRFSRLVHSGSSHQYSIILKKMWWHNLMTSTLFYKLFSLFFPLLGSFYFFVFHITLSVLMLKKGKFVIFIVILTVNNKWVVERLTFVSYCMINSGESSRVIPYEINQIL